MIVLAMLLIMGLLSGCKGISEKEEADGVMEMKYIGYKVYDPVYIAIDKGFFEKYKVEVELLDLMAAGPTAIQAISGGSAEGGLSAYMSIINARAAGLPIVACSDIQSAVGEQALEEFFVYKDSGINSIKDLKGKKIAVNNIKASFYYTVLMALEQEGLTENDVEFVLLPFSQQEFALENKRVDMIGLMQPYILHAKENQEYKVLFNALDVFGEKQFSTHFINSVWAEYNPETATAFISGITDAIAWIEKNQDEAKKIISKYTGVDVKYVEDYYFQPNGKINLEDAKYWLDYMLKRKDISADWLKVEEFATNKYNVKIK